MASLTGNYSLWIKPASPVAAKLSKEIQAQAGNFGGPLFEPHVTLLPDIKGDKEGILEKCQRLADKLNAFRINFLDVTCGCTFHKCVYILVAQEAAIMQAGATAREQFEMAPADYMPHLSLLYADLSDEAKAESMRQALQRLYGDGSSYNTLLMDNGFNAAAISLWYTPVEDKSLASWVQVAEFALSA
eukprot:gene8216-8408_t